MSIILLSDLSFGYEGSYQPVFEKLSASLDTDWRLGLTGRNGRGKTTLLRLLLENKGKPVSRAEALERVFEDSENDTNVVDVYINYLRTKIDNRFRIRLISTVRGCGYMISD